MNYRWLAIAAIVAALVYGAWPGKKAAPLPEPEAEPINQAEPISPEPAPPAPVAPAIPPPKVETAKAAAPAEKKTPPPRFDPKSARKTDLPLPKSVKELMDNRTAPKMPQLPSRAGGPMNMPDRAVFGYFAGYTYLADGTTKRLRLQRAWGDLKLAIEDHAGDIKNWSQREQTLRLDNFQQDAYSMVIELTDGRILYLKFNDEATVTGYKDPVSALYGWVLSDSSESPSVSPAALIDVHEHNRIYPPGTKDAEEWPKKGWLRSLTVGLPALPITQDPQNP